MMLDLYQLKTFYVFGKIRNFTQAAEKLFVTQSAVSHSLKKLEQSLGMPLVMRRGSEFVLTEAGDLLFQTCRRVFAELERFEEEISSGDQLKQKIVLGAQVEFGTAVLVRKLKHFQLSHPNIRVNLFFSHLLEEPLLRDEVDLIIDCRPHHHNKVERIFLFRESYVVIAAPEYLRRHPINSVRDLENAVILSLDERGEWWRNFLSAQPEPQRPEFRDIVRINHVRGLINGALEGLGISFVPHYTVENELKEKALLDVFPGASVLDDEFCIYIKPEKRRQKKNSQLIDYLRETFENVSP